MINLKNYTSFTNENKNSFTISCSKCKKIEDTFENDEKPEDYGWTFHRKKWYCGPCSKTISKEK